MPPRTTLTRVGEYLFILAGLLLVGLAASIAWTRVYEPRWWPTVPAVVVDNAIVHSGFDTYSAQFTYRYLADGVSRETTVRSTRSSSSHRVAEAMVARFPRGSTVPIQVKPGTPDRIAYDATWSVDTILLVSIVMAFATLFGGIGYVALTTFGSPNDQVGSGAFIDALTVARGAVVVIWVGLALLTGGAVLARDAWREVGFSPRGADEWRVPLMLGGAGAGLAAIGGLCRLVARRVRKRSRAHGCARSG